MSLLSRPGELLFRHAEKREKDFFLNFLAELSLSNHTAGDIRHIICIILSTFFVRLLLRSENMVCGDDDAYKKNNKKFNEQSTTIDALVGFFFLLQKELSTTKNNCERIMQI